MPWPGRTLRACVAWARRVYALALIPRGSPCWQAGHLHHFGAGDLTGLEGGEAGGLCTGLPWRFSWPCWPDLGPCWAFAAGLQCCAMRGRACDACFHCTNAQCWMAIQHQRYVLAYVLAYGIAHARLALSVWLRLARACLLSIHRMMEPR